MNSRSRLSRHVCGTGVCVAALAALAALAAAAAPSGTGPGREGSIRPRPPSASVSHPPSPAAERQAARSLAQKGIPLAPGGQLRPDQPVTRGELALILVRMIDYLENQGPHKVSQSKSPALVTPRVRAALASLPRRHHAYPAVARLAHGGYLLPSAHGDLFLPTRQNIDRPVTARELAAALAGIASRIAEKRVALEHPEVIEQQRDTITAPGQHRGLGTAPP